MTEAFTGAVGAIGGAIVAFVTQAGLTQRREASLVERVLQPHLDRIQYLERGEAECRLRAETLGAELAELRAELRIIRARMPAQDSADHG